MSSIQDGPGIWLIVLCLLLIMFWCRNLQEHTSFETARIDSTICGRFDWRSGESLTSDKCRSKLCLVPINCWVPEVTICGDGCKYLFIIIIYTTDIYSILAFKSRNCLHGNPTINSKYSMEFGRRVVFLLLPNSHPFFPPMPWKLMWQILFRRSYFCDLMYVDSDRDAPPHYHPRCTPCSALRR